MHRSSFSLFNEETQSNSGEGQLNILQKQTKLSEESGEFHLCNLDEFEVEFVPFSQICVKVSSYTHLADFGRIWDEIPLNSNGIELLIGFWVFTKIWGRRRRLPLEITETLTAKKLEENN
ncbi:unnamed protein product [Malus baccata var. baccata]